MRSEQQRSRWGMFVGEARQRWTDLTEEDFAECRVNRARLVHKLQRVYGIHPLVALDEIRQVEHLLNERLCPAPS